MLDRDAQGAPVDDVGEGIDPQNLHPIQGDHDRLRRMRDGRQVVTVVVGAPEPSGRQLQTRESPLREEVHDDVGDISL